MTRPDPKNKRMFPRARERFPVRLRMKDKHKQFEATVYTADISLSGVFFATTFFLKPGMVMDLEFNMPNDPRVVRVRGVIVREVRLVEAQRGRHTEAGFAMKFLEYFADAKTVLASSFLTADLDDFLADFIKRRSQKPKNELEGLRDVLIAWEVGQMSEHTGELNIMKDRIEVDTEGRIKRKRA
jgi:hypothetical protein